MKNLIKQYVSTGVKLTEYQFKKLNNNLLKSHLKLRVTGGKLVDYELIKLNELDKEKYNSYLSKLDSHELEQTLGKSTNPDSLVDLLITNDGFMSNISQQGAAILLEHTLDVDNLMNILKTKRSDITIDLIENSIWHLMKYSVAPDKIIKYHNNPDHFLTMITSYDVESLLNISPVPEKLMNLVLNSDGFMRKLDSDMILVMLKYSPDPEELIKSLTGKGDYLKVSTAIRSILFNPRVIEHAKQPDKLIKVLLKDEKSMSNLQSTHILRMLKYANEPEELLPFFGEKGKKAIHDLDEFGIYTFLDYTKHTHKLKAMIAKYGKKGILKDMNT